MATALAPVLQQYAIERDPEIAQRLIRSQNDYETTEQDRIKAEDMLAQAIKAMRDSLEQVNPTWKQIAGLLKDDLRKKGSLLGESISENFDKRGMLSRLSGNNELLLKGFDIYQTYKKKKEEAFSRESGEGFTRDTEDTMFDTSTQETDNRSEKTKAVFEKEQASEDALVRAEQHDEVITRLDTIIKLMEEKAKQDKLNANESGGLLDALLGGAIGGRLGRGRARVPKRGGRLGKLGGKLGNIAKGAGGSIARGALRLAGPVGAAATAGTIGTAVGTAIYEGSQNNETFKSSTDTIFGAITGNKVQSLEDADKQAAENAYNKKVSSGEKINQRLANFYESKGVKVDQSMVVTDQEFDELKKLQKETSAQTGSSSNITKEKKSDKMYYDMADKVIAESNINPVFRDKIVRLTKEGGGQFAGISSMGVIMSLKEAEEYAKIVDKEGNGDKMRGTMSAAAGQFRQKILEAEGGKSKPFAKYDEFGAPITEDRPAKSGELPVEQMNKTLNDAIIRDNTSATPAITTPMASPLTEVTPTAKRLESAINREASVGSAIEAGTAEVSDRNLEIQASTSAAVVAKATSAIPPSQGKTSKTVFQPGAGSAQNSTVPISARNSDSSIQRVTERYITFGMT